MLIKAQNLHKIYQDERKKVTALNGISLELDKGEFAVIIGPSGAGKSTLLHILGALDKPSEGKVLFDGLDLYGISDNRRSLIRNKRIGFVFQFYHLLPEFSVLENVELPGLINPQNKSFPNAKSPRKLRERSLELLEAVGLKNRLTHRPLGLSGGEAQKTAIARALINQPDIIFCDEPTGNLDSESSLVILELLKDLNKRYNQALVMVTHNERLAAFAKRTISIKDGIIISDKLNSKT